MVGGCSRGQLDLDDRLDALEAVLPRHDEPDGRAVRVREDPAVETDGEDRQRVHRLVEAQALDVRPVENGRTLARHLRRVEERRESDVARARGRLDVPQERREREPEPGDDHRPGLDAAHAIDAFLQRVSAEQVVGVELAGPLDLAADRDRPGAGAESRGLARGIVLARSELIEVVVSRDVRIRGAGLTGAVGARKGLEEEALDRARARAGRVRQPQESAPDARRGGGEEERALEKSAPVGCRRFRRDLGRRQGFPKVGHGAMVR